MQTPFLPLGYDPQLARIIATVESSRNPFAIRFEPSITSYDYNLLETIYKRNYLADGFPSSPTAKVIYAVSLGQYQIMGYNLYQLGYQFTVGQFLSDGSAQNKFFGVFLNAHGINSTWQTLKTDSAALNEFALKYNGSDAYVAAMQKAARELGL